MPRRHKPPERTFQQHVADFLVREHGYGVLEQAPPVAQSAGPCGLSGHNNFPILSLCHVPHLEGRVLGSPTFARHSDCQLGVNVRLMVTLSRKRPCCLDPSFARPRDTLRLGATGRVDHP